MADPAMIVLLLVILLCAWLTVAAPPTDGQSPDYLCPTTICSPTGPKIQFPFRLNTQPPGCGLPGPSFELFCRNNMTLLHLQPSLSLQVYVVGIDYKNSILKVTDAGGCLAHLIFNFNLSASPFKYYYYTPSRRGDYVITALDCSFVPTAYTQYIYSGPVPCISRPGHSIMYTFQFTEVSCLPPSCNVMKTVESPIYYDFAQGTSIIDLTWDLPQCRRCEKEGRRCGFKNKTTTEIGCFDIDHPHQGHRKKMLIIGLVVGLSGLLLMTVVGYKAYKHIEEEKVEVEYQRKVELFLQDYKSLRPTRYSLKEIKKMTDNFKTKLGQGGFGSVFKGQLPNGVLVAVKLLENSGTGDGNDFINEVGTIGRIHHVNIVRLLGFCVERLKRALIYEFMPNESLEKFIFSNNGNGPSLDWTKVHEIAVGIARGIEYLHQGCDQCILHFDIKPHNILLDQNLNPKISDFGLAKLCRKDQSAVSMTAARGTMGYIAPEVFSRNFGNVSYKSDIFSFGMLLLEMVGGRKNIDIDVEQVSKVYFPQWIYLRLVEDGDLGLNHIGAEDKEIPKKLTIVALWCIQWNSTDRPSIRSVLQMLEGGPDALILPPNPFDAASHTPRLSVIAE